MIPVLKTDVELTLARADCLARVTGIDEVGHARELAQMYVVECTLIVPAARMTTAHRTRRATA